MNSDFAPTAKDSSQRETIRYICDFSRCRLNVRLCARIQPLLRGHKYGLFILLRVVLWLGRCRYRESDCRIAQKSIQKSSTNYRLQPRTSPSALPQKGHCRSQKRFENYNFQISKRRISSNSSSPCSFQRFSSVPLTFC